MNSTTPEPDTVCPAFRADLLEQARHLARGTRQKAWLYFLVDGHEGLDRDGQQVRRTTLERMDAFLLRLRESGFRIEERALGPRKKNRLDLTEWDPLLGRSFRTAQRISSRGVAGSGAVLDPGADLLFRSLPVDELAIAEAFASNGWTGTVDDLIEVTRGVAS